MHPSSLALKLVVRTGIQQQMSRNQPVLDDTVVEKNAPDDLGHLSNRAMPPNDRLFYARPFVDLGGIAYYCIARYLGLLVDQCPLLRIRGECISCGRQELAT